MSSCGCRLPPPRLSMACASPRPRCSRASISGRRPKDGAPTTSPMTEPALPPRRWPLVPTLLVALAVLIMVALGVWQLKRKGEKEALIALYERNRAMSATVAYPALAPVPDAMLFQIGRAHV